MAFNPKVHTLGCRESTNPSRMSHFFSSLALLLLPHWIFMWIQSSYSKGRGSMASVETQLPQARSKAKRACTRRRVDLSSDCLRLLPSTHIATLSPPVFSHFVPSFLPPLSQSSFRIVVLFCRFLWLCFQKTHTPRRSIFVIYYHPRLNIFKACTDYGDHE